MRERDVVMGRKRRKLTASLLCLSVIPLLCSGIVVLVITSRIIYDSLRDEIRESLRTTTYLSYKIYNQIYPGDFVEDGEHVTKGGNASGPDTEVIDDIKMHTGVDVTLFYGDIRWLTTVKYADGSRVTGTRAHRDVTTHVLNAGSEYFSDSVLVNGEKYFGYYMPVRNTDSRIMGMIFTGKPRRQVMRDIRNHIFVVCLLEVVTMLVAVCFVLHYGKRMIYSLHETERFLGQIAEGNLGASLDPYVLGRKDEVGEMGRFASVLRDSIVELVGSDPLTGLGNRRSCDIALKNTVGRARKKNMPFVIVMADIDYFKKVNDTYGHQAGDEVLKTIADTFRAHMIHHGFVFRWGGEEFLLIYEDMAKEAVCTHLGQLQNEIRSLRIPWEKEEIRVTMTFGVADFEGENKPEELVRRADENLYRGKHGGRDRIVR